MVLVTGATGNNGAEIVKRLVGQNVQVRAIVRNRDRASAAVSFHARDIYGLLSRHIQIYSPSR